MIFFIEHALTHQTEVGHVLFLLAGIDATPAGAAAELPGNRSEVRPGGGAVAEAAQAGPEDGAKDAIAWRGFGFVDNAGSVAFAVLARFMGQPNSVRSIPLHYLRMSFWPRTLGCVRSPWISTAFSTLSPERKTSMNSNV